MTQEQDTVVDFTCWVAPEAMTFGDDAWSQSVDLAADPSPHEELVVRLHSREEPGPFAHPTLSALLGRRVRVRIDVLGE